MELQGGRHTSTGWTIALGWIPPEQGSLFKSMLPQAKKVLPRMKLGDHLQRPYRPEKPRVCKCQGPGGANPWELTHTSIWATEHRRMLPDSSASSTVCREQIFCLLSERNWRLSSLKIIWHQISRPTMRTANLLRRPFHSLAFLLRAIIPHKRGSAKQLQGRSVWLV